MRERISGKLGNRNDNAFKLRKLFAMFDKQRTGKVALLTHRPWGCRPMCACCLGESPICTRLCTLTQWVVPGFLHRQLFPHQIVSSSLHDSLQAVQVATTC